MCVYDFDWILQYYNYLNYAYFKGSVIMHGVSIRNMYTITYPCLLFTLHIY